MKKLLCLFMIFCLVFSISGCKKSETEITPQGSTAQNPQNTVLSLAYNQTDSLNPYTAQTDINRSLAGLIYDSPVRVNSDFTYTKILAESINISENICVLKIKNAYFTDGSAVTADDIIYSFSAAKKSSSRFKYTLSSILSAEKSDANTVRFTLKNHDIYAANLLTFPVFKSGSDNIKDENGLLKAPIGCGRYIPDLENEQLIANANRAGGSVSYKTIRLINCAGDEALSHIIDIGAIDAYFTRLDDCKIMRMQGKRENITLNNLVYIGFNTNDAVCKNTNFRHAVSSALNRAKICNEAYFTNAVAATGIFHPNWKEVSSIQSISDTANTNIAIENLSQMGYNTVNGSLYAVSPEGTELTVKLLVNKENQFRLLAADMIVKQLAQAKIKVVKEEVTFEVYKKRLAAKQFQMYLAETNITDNMDISPIVCKGGNIAFGLTQNASSDVSSSSTASTEQTAADTALSENTSSGEQPAEKPSTVTLESVIKGFYSGKNTIADIASLAVSEMPIVPVCYRTGIIFGSDKINNLSNYGEGDIYAFIK